MPVETYAASDLSPPLPEDIPQPLPTDATGFEVIHIGLPGSTSVIADVSSTVEPLNSAHKIPNSLWSVFENSREQERGEASTTTAAVAAAATGESVVAANTEVAAAAGHVTIVDVEELPKPDEHTSEVLLIEEIVPGVTQEESAESNNVETDDEAVDDEEEEEEGEGHKLPKAFDFGLPDLQTVVGDVQIHSFGLEQAQRYVFVK
jgi:hypothetical protein